MIKQLLAIPIALFVFAALPGCAKAPHSTAGSETTAQEAAETDPFIKQVVALPRDQRKAFIAAHHAEVVKGGPQLFAHLHKLLPAD